MTAILYSSEQSLNPVNLPSLTNPIIESRFVELQTERWEATSWQFCECEMARWSDIQWSLPGHERGAAIYSKYKCSC